MIPLLIMLGAMLVGAIAPQVAKRKAMEGVFNPPLESVQVPELVVISPLEGRQ